MSCRVARLLIACVLLYSSGVMLHAQELASDPPAHVSWVEGSAVLERDGQPDNAPANMPLLAGDRLRTDAGRVEVLFADGSTLALDERTTVDFQSDDLIRLLEGRVRLSIPGRDRRVGYRIDAPSASARIDAPGDYRVSLLPRGGSAELELAVLRGAATLLAEGGETALGAGQRALAREGAAPSYAYAFNSAAWDSFDRWAETRRDARLGLAAQYLPEEVRPYAAAFGRAGAWRYEASYGYVWYPPVSAGWRPYSNGRWATLRPYGWTWIGAEPWDWPTHHYGRWGLSAGAWFWIPGRRWAPAWVSWAYAPGYVSWCPLGWNDRPVVQIVNIYDRTRYDRGRYDRGGDPWRAWTAVPDRQFGRGSNVRSVMARDLEIRGSRGFVPRDRGPEARDYAVPRAAAPIRAAGVLPGRQADSPVYTNLDPASARVGAGSRIIVGAPRTGAEPSARIAGSAPAGGDGPSAGVQRPRAVPREDAPRDARLPPSAAHGGIPSTTTATPQGAVREDWRTRSSQEPWRTGARQAPAPYDGSPRAVPRDVPIYRSPGAARDPRLTTPVPDPGSTGRPDPRVAIPRADPRVPTPSREMSGQAPAPETSRAPAAGGLPARSPYGPGGYDRPAPNRPAPERPSEPVGRAVPRMGPPPAGDRVAPEAHPGGGGDRRGPDRPAGPPADGGRSHSGGRSR